MLDEKDTLTSLIVRTFLSVGRFLGIFPFKVQGSQLIPISWTSQIISFCFVSLTLVFGGSYMFSEVQRYGQDTSHAMQGIRILETLVYFVNLASFGIVALALRPRIFNVLEHFCEIKVIVEELKLRIKFQNNAFYVRQVIKLATVMFLVLVSFILIFAASFENFVSLFVISMFVIHLVVQLVAVTAFFFCFLHFMYIYDLVIMEVENVEARIYFLCSHPPNSTFLTDSCELSDKIDLLIKLQMEIYICMKKTAKVLQLPLLGILLLLVIGCISHVSEAYQRLSLVVYGEEDFTVELLFAITFSFEALSQLHYIAAGPEFVLRKHMELVRRLNMIVTDKVEWRLDRSVRNYFPQI